jgi:hypothetical protein
LIAGGAGGASTDSAGGDGGIGVFLGGGTLSAGGTITGGNGGSGEIGNGGNGGTGIYVNGGTVTVSGTVSGGAGGASLVGTAGAAGDAVLFGDSAGTLVIDPGAVFHGQVAGDGAASDTLELAGSGQGALSGLGTIFTGFANLLESTGANWVFGGTNSRGAGGSMVVDGTLSTAGTFYDSGSVTLGKGGTLAASGDGALKIAGLTLSGGAATGALGGTFSVGTTAGAVDAITVQSNGAISGYGTLQGAPIVDAGKITASGGTLTLATALSGAGTATIAAGGALAAASSVGGLSLTFGGAGTLLLETPASVTSTIGGFGSGDVIDASLVANTLTYAGGTLTLQETSGSTTNTVGTLKFSGSLTVANFHLASDGHGGTDIGFLAPATKPHTPILPDFAPYMHGFVTDLERTVVVEHWSRALAIDDMPAFHSDLLMLLKD